MGLSYGRRRVAGSFNTVQKNGIGRNLYRQIYLKGSYLYPNGYTRILADTSFNTGTGLEDGARAVCLDYLNPGPPYKTGKPLSIYKPFVECRPSGTISRYSKGPVVNLVYSDSSYNGCFYPTWASVPYTGVPWTRTDIGNAGGTGYFSGSTYGDPSALGPKAWNKFKPTKSSFDAAYFLGESKELLPMLRTSALGFQKIYKDLVGYRRLKAKHMPRDIADQYLNIQFGWIPFISDLRKFVSTAVSAERQIAQLKRDNNQWVRREGSVSTNVTEDWLATSSGSHGWHQPQFGDSILFTPVGGKYSVSDVYRRQSDKIWFSAAFRYWIPEYVNAPTELHTLHDYMRLYGIRISPQLVWNLTPWTWLADWFTGIGDNISNWADSGDSLVAKYAFIMQHREESQLLRSQWFFTAGNYSWSWRRGCYTKLRRCASPYGFSIDVSSFTARRWAILAALGLTRLKLEM